MTPRVEDPQDPRRTEPPFLLGERAMLEAWLEFHRTTSLLKYEGLDDAGHKRRPVPTLKLSLHGLVRHLAEVERNWFRRVLLGDRLAPPILTTQQLSSTPPCSTTRHSSPFWLRVMDAI
jgi:Protein of unknown function (DUF664)